MNEQFISHGWSVSPVTVQNSESKFISRWRRWVSCVHSEKNIYWLQVVWTKANRQILAQTWISFTWMTEETRVIIGSCSLWNQILVRWGSLQVSLQCWRLFEQHQRLIQSLEHNEGRRRGTHHEHSFHRTSQTHTRCIHTTPAGRSSLEALRVSVCVSPEANVPMNANKTEAVESEAASHVFGKTSNTDRNTHCCNTLWFVKRKKNNVNVRHETTVIFWWKMPSERTGSGHQREQEVGLCWRTDKLWFQSQPACTRIRGPIRTVQPIKNESYIFLFSTTMEPDRSSKKLKRYHIQKSPTDQCIGATVWRYFKYHVDDKTILWENSKNKFYSQKLAKFMKEKWSLTLKVNNWCEKAPNLLEIVINLQLQLWKFTEYFPIVFTSSHSF